MDQLTIKVAHGFRRQSKGDVSFYDLSVPNVYREHLLLLLHSAASFPSGNALNGLIWFERCKRLKGLN